MQVILPHIHFTETELQALQDPDTVHEAIAMRDAHHACFEVVILQTSRAHWLCLVTRLVLSAQGLGALLRVLRSFSSLHSLFQPLPPSTPYYVTWFVPT